MTEIVHLHHVIDGELGDQAVLGGISVRIVARADRREPDDAVATLAGVDRDQHPRHAALRVDRAGPLGLDVDDDLIGFKFAHLRPPFAARNFGRFGRVVHLWRN